MKDDRPVEGMGPGDEKRPPRRGNYRLETPFYEEEFDPYFVDQVDAPSTEDGDRVEDPEEEWYWREPDNYWLQEDMWPWPEPGPRRRPESRHPSNREP